MRWLTLHYDHTLLVNLLGNKEAEQVLSNAYKVNIIPQVILMLILFVILHCLFFLHYLFVYSSLLILETFKALEI